MIVVSVVLILTTSVYVLFQSKVVQTWIISGITKSVSDRLNAEVSIGKVNVSFFNKLVLDDVYISDQQKDTLIYIEKLLAGVDSLSFKSKHVQFKSIVLKNPKVHVVTLDSSNNYSFLFEERDVAVTTKWSAVCRNIQVLNGDLTFTKRTEDTIEKQIVKKTDIELEQFIIPSFDHFSFYLKHLAFDAENLVTVKSLNAKVDFSDNKIQINELIGKTNKSIVKASKLALDLGSFFETGDWNSLSFDFDIHDTKIGIADLAVFVPEVKRSKLMASISGQLYGSIGNLKGKDIKASIGDFTHIAGAFYLNGLPLIEETYIFVELEESYADLAKLRSVDLTEKFSALIESAPVLLNNVGEFSYKGNFSGFINDFVAYGTAYSNLGEISADIAIAPQSGSKVLLNGKLNTQNLEVGKIIQNNLIGALTMQGMLSGYFDDENYNIDFDGLVDSVLLNNYGFKNIDLDGRLSNKKFNGKLQIDDPNLKLSYEGSFNFLESIPSFEFETKIDFADLYKLNLVDDSIARLALNLSANFEGKNIDNLLGNLHFHNLWFVNQVDTLVVDSISIENKIVNHQNEFTLTSDLVDAKLNGHYHFSDIYNSILALYAQYIPSSLTNEYRINKDLNDFNFSINVFNLEPLTSVFYSSLFIETPFKIEGFYKPSQNQFLIESNIPFVKVEEKGIEKIKLRIGCNNEKLFARFKTDKVRISDQLNIYNLTFESSGANDQLDLNCYWNNYDEVSYSGSVRTHTQFSKNKNSSPHVAINFKPSKIYFADSLWQIAKSLVELDSTRIAFNDFRLSKGNEYLYLNGAISELNTDVLFTNIKNVNMQLLKPLMGRSNFDGFINGTATIRDYYTLFKLNLDLDIQDLTMRGSKLGDLTVVSNWDSEKENLESEVRLVSADTVLMKANGAIDPMNKTLDLNATFDHTPISILQAIMSSSFYGQEGKASGMLTISGHTNDILLNGSLKPVDEAALGISFLQTKYYFSDAINFKDRQIIFDHINVWDEYENTGMLNGSITHANFRQLKYDLDITANKVLALNTSIADNEEFYGTAFATGQLQVGGTGLDIEISGNFKSEKGTEIFIPFESTEDAKQYDFVEFIDHSKTIEKEVKYDVVTSGINMNFDIELTPDANIQLVFNSQTGDVISGVGTGNLNVKVDRNYKIQMYGDYLIEKGDYLFTLQNVINKRFSIERGGTIKWFGDPYNAIIELRAVYKVKTSLKDLFIDDYNNIDLTRRMPVDCIIMLSNNLTSPTIKLDLELPTAEERIRDEINQLIVTNEDKNKQIISLLLMGRFYTPEILAGMATNGTGARTELVGTTASELFSNQLSNWLSQISNTWDVGVNYRPGNELTNDQIEFALSTQFFDDRVTIDGNIANNSNQTSTNSSDFIGEFDLNIKLTENGKLQFKAYTHANDNLIDDTAPYTQGIGFSFREEFKSIKELLNRYASGIFKRNEKKVDNEMTNTTN